MFDVDLLSALLGLSVTFYIKQACLLAGFLSLLFLISGFVMLTASAAADSPAAPVDNSGDRGKAAEPWYKRIDSQWGGRIRLLGSVFNFADGTIYDVVRDDTYYNGAANLRITNDTYFNARTYFSVHYETLYSAGDIQRVQNKLNALLPDALSDDGVIVRSPVNDDHRFFDLTRTINEGDSTLLLHRLDRLALTREMDNSLVRIGRQAVTWGNGFLFNPMDLFNPFAPTQIDRDYKIGDDMIFASFSQGHTGDLQLLYVPRRNPEDGEVQWAQSSLAGKMHFAIGTTEFDVMAAAHYDDAVVGFGSRGYLGDAAWRLDATWTFLSKANSEKGGYLALVANMDYSWVWWVKNFYGYIELYFNGLGEDNYSQALTNQALMEQIARGEIFTLGREYLSVSMQAELHPLFNLFLTSINNIADPSGIFQLYGIWDLTQTLQFTAGGNIPWGASETEYGGFTIPGTGFKSQPPLSAFLWLTYYF